MADNRQKRKESYERQRAKHEQQCEKCRKTQTPTYDRCNDCSTGRALRRLQTEFSDVTGWSHDLW